MFSHGKYFSEKVTIAKPLLLKLSSEEITETIASRKLY